MDEFLFGNRTGFCEQISTALAVMLRSIGIPAREAAGYVPGTLQPHHRPLRRPGQRRPRLGPGVVPRLRVAELRPHRGGPPGQPVTGLDAGARRHPGPRPAARGCRSRWFWPWRRWWHWSSPGAGAGRAPGPRRRRAASRWPGAERAVHGDPARRSPSTPPPSTRLAGDRSGTWQALAGVVEASAYGGRHPTPEDDRQILATMRALRSELPRAGVLAGAGALRRGDGPARRRSSPPPRAGGGSPSAGGDG